MMRRQETPGAVVWDGTYDPAQPRWLIAMSYAYLESLLESCVRTPLPVSVPYTLTRLEEVRRRRYAPTYGHAIKGRALLADACLTFAEGNREACETYISLHATDMGQGTLIQGWTAIGFAFARARNLVLPGFWSPRDGALGTILDRAAENLGPQVIYRHNDGRLVVSESCV